MSTALNNRYPRTLFNEEHEAVRDAFRRFLLKEVEPHYLRWEREGIIPHEVFEAAGQAGFMNLPIPEEYGGAGVDDFRYSVVFNEECARLGLLGFGMGMSLGSDVVLPYFMAYATEEQKRRWFPDMASSKLMMAIAMTEPSGGSDLASLKTHARRTADGWVVNGSKTFITNGINADLVLTAVKTDASSRHGGISLLVIERGMPGFERGRNLDKVGLHSQDTAELYFNDVHVPEANLIGIEHQGFKHMMVNLPQERLGIAMSAVNMASACLDWTVTYVKERHAFGKPIGTFQHSRMVIAEMRTTVEIAQVFLDRSIDMHLRGELTDEQAAMGKWWCTDMLGRVVDRCVQLFGGYGYMSEYPIARAFVDARIMRIYGGTNEIMKEIIGKAEGLKG
ncbi:MAG: acyl-CoA dehydrogenase family protein [Burkholderiales bacterium]